MAKPEIEVRGIRELNKALKDVSGDLPKELRDGFKQVALSVVQGAQAKVPEITGNARASIKPRASSRGAGIAFGGTKSEYFPWLNFGGSVGRNKSNYRDRVLPDRYIYATIQEQNDKIRSAVDDVLENVIKGAGFDTKGGE